MCIHIDLSIGYLHDHSSQGIGHFKAGLLQWTLPGAPLAVGLEMAIGVECCSMITDCSEVLSTYYTSA